MTLSEAVRSALSKYAEFHGRGRRSEFWWFVLFGILITAVGGALDDAIHSELLGALISIGLFLPSLALQVRRLHDIGQSGWWLLIALLPIIGFILLIVWWCQEGDPRENAYGPDPKGPRGMPAMVGTPSVQPAA